MPKQPVPVHTRTSRLIRFTLCLLLLVATVIPVATVLPAKSEAAVDDTPYFVDNATWYRDFAPGIISPNEGTVEMTVRFDKPYSDFGAWYDFMFRLIPGQSGPGNTLYSVHMSPPTSKPTGSTYDQPLTFFVKNGNGTTGAFAYAQPADLNYTIGQPFNLAFTWKLGPSGYVAIYKDGVQLARTSTSIDPVQEKYIPYEFMVERGAPYNVTNLKVSTRSLDAAELEHSTSAFTRGTDTSLLADIALGQPVQTQKFVTPWHASSGYSVVKPAFRSDKQVFVQNEDAVFPMMTVNYGSAQKTYNVNIKVKYPNGDTAFTRSIPVDVPADGTYRIQELPLPELDNKVGFWYLETTASSSASDVVTYNSAISKVPLNDTAVPDGKYASYYGTHVDYKDSMSSWKKINTDTTRGWEDAKVFLWYNIEPTSGHFTWEHSDQYVSSANAAGMDVLAVLGYPSNWNSTRPPVSGIPAEGYKSTYQYQPDRYVSKDIQYHDGVPGSGDRWTNYVYQTMKRYAGKVKYYEIVNEVNFHPPYLPASFSGTADEYFLMLKIAHEQAQRVKTEYKAETGQDLELYISSSGFTSVAGSSADRQMAIDVLKEPYVGYYDIYNIHGYSGTKTIKDDVLPAFKAAQITHPNLKLWQGEFGPLNDLYSTNIPAKLYGTVDKYLDFLSNGTDKYFGFGSPGDDTFATRHTVSPTEVFQTTAVMQNQIRKVDQYIGSYTGFTNEAYLTINHYMRRTDGKYLSILSADRQPLNINIQNSDKIVRVEDNYGNVVPVQPGGTVYKKDTVFIVSNEPLWIDSVTGNVLLTTIRNGDFEKLSGDPMGGPSAVTIDNWTMISGVYGTNAYVNKTSPYQGANVVEFNSSGAPGNRTFMNQSFSITKSGRYVLSAYIKKVEGGSDVQPELNIWAGNTDHQLAPVTLSNQYGYYTKSFDVSQPMDITVNIGILSGVGKVAFDNVSFELVPDNVTIEMDNSDATGVKFLSTTTSNAWDNSKLNASANKGNFALNTSRDGLASATFTPSVPLSGMYDVYEWHHITDSTTAAPFTINHARGTAQVLVNQSNTYGGKWNKIGSYPFNAGSAGSLVISNGFASGTGNFMLADGIKFVRTGDIPSLFANGDFESATGNPLVLSNWSMGAGTYGTNVYVNQTSPYQGTNAVEFSSAGVPSGHSELTQKFTVLDSGTYSLSAYIKKVEGGSDVQPELSIGDGTIDHAMGSVALTDKYAYYASTFTVPQRMEVTVKIGMLSGAGKVVFDNVAFTLVPDNVEIIMDNKDTSGVMFSDATWSNAGVNAGAYNGGFALNTTKGGKSSATYTPAIPEAGVYDVYEWHHSTAGPTDAPFTIRYATGLAKVAVDQSKNGIKWNKIGTFPFLPGSTGNVVITNGNLTGNFILADGIRFVRTGPYVPVESIAVIAGNTSATVPKGDTLTLKTVVAPSNAANPVVVWSVANGTGQATIDTVTGVLTGLVTGTVNVIATATDGTGIQGRLQVNVVELDHVTVSANKSILKSGDQAALSVAGFLTDGTQADLSKAVVAYSSDSAAASVDTMGVVTATSAGEGTVNLTVSVTLGNRTVAAGTTVQVDNTPPADAALSADITTPTNADVTVTINYPEDVAVKEYKLGISSTWTVYGAPVVVSENATLYGRGTDAAGNVSNVTSYVVGNIDHIAPADATLAIDTTAPTNQGVTVTISYPDDAAVKEYKVGASGGWTAYTAPIVVADNDTVYARGTDAVGNVSNVTSITVNNIYKIAPITTATLSPAAPNGKNSWYTTDVSVSFSVYASVYGGTVTTEYQVNDGAWTSYTGSIPAFGEGTYKLGYRSKDQAGNVEHLKTVEFKVDKTAPALSVQLDKTTIWPANHKMVTVNAVLNSSDATSGVESVVLTSITSNKPDSGQGDIQNADFGTADTSFSLRAEKSRTYTITYTATDKAGNKTVTTTTVTVPHDQSGNGNNNQSGNQ